MANKTQNIMRDEIKIDLEESIAEGVQTNLTIISHSTSEFVLDFIRLIPGTNKGKVKSRIILSPDQAKRLILSLDDNVSHYESMFGEIKVIPTEAEIQTMNFGIQGEA